MRNSFPQTHILKLKINKGEIGEYIHTYIIDDCMANPDDLQLGWNGFPPPFLFTNSSNMEETSVADRSLLISV